MSNEQLVAALQARCHFEPGEVRVVMLDAQPIHRQRQEYRLVDAATGEFERGVVRVADMVTRQPWDDTVPVQVTWSADRYCMTSRTLTVSRPFSSRSREVSRCLRQCASAPAPSPARSSVISRR